MMHLKKPLMKIDPILGCTDSDAENYDSQATEDDGSCEYEEPEPEPEPEPVQWLH